MGRVAEHDGECVNAIVEPTRRITRQATSLARGCPVCGADRPRPLYENPMAPIDAFDFSYAVVRCGSCPMIYADRALAPDAMARYYRDLSKYDGGAPASSGDLHRARFAAGFVRRLVDADARILDVGCSTGAFLAELVGLGNRDVVGIEPSENAVATARSRYGLEVSVGDAMTHDDFERFDVVTLLAVLEHLREPAGIVRRIAASMRPEALFVVEVPDAGAFGRQQALGDVTEPFGEFSIEHINFFGDAALRRLASACGLTAVACETLECESKQYSLFAAFRKAIANEAPVDPADAHESVVRYVERSQVAMQDVDRRLYAIGASRRAIVYGAGSHTARLLGRTTMNEIDVVTIVDRNRNLVGRTMHGAQIAEPRRIASHPGLPVVASTFRARAEIAAYVSSQFANPLVPLYASASERSTEGQS